MTMEGYFPAPDPGHYSSRNVNANNCVWPFYNVDNFFNNGNYYNGALFLPSPDQHLVQSKEVVKQTMLKHEAIFKDQIRELHRIYWRHRELMDEMEKNELLKHHRQQGPLQSNPLSPQDLCDHPQKTSLVLSLPGVNPACYRSSVPTVENDLSLSQFNDRRFAHSGPDPAQTELSLKGQLLESSKKLGKRILDLELPPIEYIDSEDEESLQKVPEVSGDPLNRISEAVHKSDWQPYRGNGGFNSVFQEHNLNPGLVSFKKNLLADLNKPTKLEGKLGTISIYLPDLNEPSKIEEEVAAASKFLVDLNEPIEFEEEAALSSDFQSPLAGHAELSCQDLAQKSSSGFQVSPTDNNTQTERDSETCSNDLHLEKYDDEAVLLFLGQSRRDVASLTPGLSEEVSASLQNIDLKQTDEHETSHFVNQGNRKSCGEDLETLGKSLSSDSNPVPVSTNNEGTSSQLISLTDVGSSKPSSVSSSKKQIFDIVRTPIIVQGLPCFNWKRSKSSITGPGVAGKRPCHGKGLKFSPKFDNASFHQSSFCTESSAESKTLESHPPSISSNGQDVNEENDLAFEHHGPTKPEDLVRGLPWLRTQSLCKRKRGESREPSTQVEIHHNPCEDEAKKNDANDGVINMNLDRNPVSESGEQVASHKLVVGSGLEKQISCFEAGIGMNLCMEDDECSPTPSLPKDLGLEAPVSPENKESSPPRRDSDENEFETPSELSGKEDGDVREDPARNAVEDMVVGEEDVDLQEELSRNAATALVSISSSVVPICPETAACEPSEPSRSDELHWFAKAVFSVVDDPDSEVGVVLSSKNNGDYEECMLNGLDYFEAMTLNLIEIKVEEADRFNTNDREGKKEEERGANYFPSQQRRGGMRRARQQRKDFQSEILPSLASLSRCEVTEDLQTIEGLMEAANSQRGIVCTRSISRNTRARGRKRSCIPTSNLTDNTICSPSKQQIRITEKDTQERRLTLGGIGWGSITRRRRGPRSPATNPWLR